MKHVHVLEPVDVCWRRGFSIEHKAKAPASGPGQWIPVTRSWPPWECLSVDSSKRGRERATGRQQSMLPEPSCNLAHPACFRKVLRTLQLVPAHMALEFSESNVECWMLSLFSVNLRSLLKNEFKRDLRLTENKLKFNIQIWFGKLMSAGTSCTNFDLISFSNFPEKRLNRNS